jgi:hypothetical protein
VKREEVDADQGGSKEGAKGNQSAMKGSEMNSPSRPRDVFQSQIFARLMKSRSELINHSPPPCHHPFPSSPPPPHKSTLSLPSLPLVYSPGLGRYAGRARPRNGP